MRIIFSRSYLRIAVPLLCLFLTFSSSCGSLKSTRIYHQIGNVKVLKVSINVQDYTEFMQQMQELFIIPVEVQKITNEHFDMIWLSFQFNNSNNFLTSRSAILATGLVRQIN